VKAAAVNGWDVRRTLERIVACSEKEKGTDRFIDGQERVTKRNRVARAAEAKMLSERVN
jgi:hypothetical protein